MILFIFLVSSESPFFRSSLSCLFFVIVNSAVNLSLDFFVPLLRFCTVRFLYRFRL
jgi:hypothetical protein